VRRPFCVRPGVTSLRSPRSLRDPVLLVDWVGSCFDGGCVPPPLARPQPPRTHQAPRPAPSNAPSAPTSRPGASETQRSLVGVSGYGASDGAFTPAGLDGGCVQPCWPVPSRRERTVAAALPGPRASNATPRCVQPRWPAPSRRERTTRRGQPPPTHRPRPPPDLAPAKPGVPSSASAAGGPPMVRSPPLASTAGAFTPAGPTPAAANALSPPRCPGIAPRTRRPGALTRAGPTPAAANAPRAEASPLQRTLHAHLPTWRQRNPAFHRMRQRPGGLRWCVRPGWPRRWVRSPPLARPQPPRTHRTAQPRRLARAASAEQEEVRRGCSEKPGNPGRTVFWHRKLQK
jgi:hypothetical protein